MLRSMAVFSMKSVFHAAGIITLLSLAALVIPPLNFIASAMIVLYALKMGPKQGLKSIMVAALLLAVVTMIAFNSMMIPVVFLLSSWLPVYAVTYVLGSTRSLNTTVLAAGLFGILFILGLYLLIEQPTAWWQQLMSPFWERVSQQPGWQFSPEKTEQVSLNLSSIMTGLAGANLTINLIIGVIIGRSLQARLFNPGGFSAEFKQLTLGKSAALVAIALMLVTMLPLGSGIGWLQQCVFVVLVTFVIQGLSVVHAVVELQQKSPVWLVVIYALLIVMLPQMILLLAILGIVEQWIHFRHRLTKTNDDS